MTRCFIIGHPIAHSRSPLIHGEWLRQHGLDGSYERVDVAPTDLPRFFERLRANEFAGGNVTVPHKEAVMPHLDVIGPAALAIGAVNTLWWEDGKLHGDNTDAFGFLAHLDATVPGWDQQASTALILGAGGAARAIVYALKERGLSQITIVNRNRDRADDLVAAFGSPLLAGDWAARETEVERADLIVNTTSLGMHGQPPLDLDLSRLRPGAVVNDIVYVPLDTPLLAAAKRHGGHPVDGLGMLLHQAIPGFARWFGVRPQVTMALRQKIEHDLGPR